MTFPKTRILLHIVGWLTFFILPFMFFRFGMPPPVRSLHHLEIEQLILPAVIISNFLLVIVFYLNYTILFNRFCLAKKYIQYSLLILGLLTSIITLSLVCIYFLNVNNIFFLPYPFIGGFLFRFFIILIFSSGIAMYDNWTLAESEKLKAEVAYLKAQINPHFLFNTLNSIYFLAIKKAENTADSIVKLSNIMRYVTNQSKQDTVALDQEINYIDSYIELQKLRLTNKTSLNYSIINESSYKKIAPLLLISFIENAFKYGVDMEKETVITIKIKVDNYQLNLFVENSITQKNNLPSDNASGLGIKNTTKRLDLLYPKHYKLKIDEKKDTYTVDLTILLV